VIDRSVPPRPRHALVLLLSLILAGSIGPAARGSAAAAADSPGFVADTSRFEASDQLEWRVAFRVTNPFAVGLYLDSLSCEVEDLGPGETRGPRTTVIDASASVRALETLSAGESGNFEFTGSALAEHAKLTFRLRAHRADGNSYSVATQVEALPGPVSREHPSEFIDVGGKRVETILFPAARDSGLAPGLLLVHGHANHARKMMRSGQLLAQRGYTVMLVSMPGYGQSDGPADFMGPATVRALDAALDRLKRAPGVDPKRLGAWGVSRGATAVTLLAEKRADLAAVVSQAGVYDLWAGYRGTRIPGIRETIVREVGPDSAAWRARSPALAPGRPAAAFLILHGEEDLNVPAAQAHAFVETLKARGTQVESHFFPASEHMLPRGQVLGLALDFFARHLGG
jgi:dipeptidyl aminopeptidase/acylaminoacyl peptidase